MIALSYLNKRQAGRARAIAFNVLRQLLVPVFSLLISRNILANSIPGLWGEFVYFYAIVLISGNILDWGNKELLLRKFSENPASIKSLWQSSITSRLVLLLIPLIWISLIGVSYEIKLLLLVWVFFRFLQQSFEVLIVYNKAFHFSAVIELIAFCFLLSSIAYFGASLNLIFLISLYILSGLFSLLIVSFYFRKYFVNFIKPVFNSALFFEALPFFLLGFSGLIQSRTDLLIIKEYLSSELLGHYQVIINLVFFAHAIPNLLLLPFVKNLYRINKKTYNRISKRLVLAAPAFIILSVFTIYLFITRFYNIDLDFFMMALAALILFPSYIYSPIIYQLFKNKKQQKVIIINVIGLVVNIVANILFLPVNGIKGALLACVLGQWVILFAYIIFQRIEVKNQELN